MLADLEGKTARDDVVLRDLLLAEITQCRSFIIGPDGKLRKHDPDVDPSTQTQVVPADLTKLKPTG